MTARSPGPGEFDPWDILKGGIHGVFAPNPQVAAPAPMPAPYVPAQLAPLSQQTLDAHNMVNAYAQSNTPQQIQSLATDISGYRNTAATALDQNSALNQTITSGIANLGQYANRAGPNFTAYAPLSGQTATAQSIQAAQMGAAPTMHAAQMGATAGVTAAEVAAVDAIRAKQGADYMNTYMNPYLSQVVDSSLADFDVGVDRQAAQNRARRDASSAFGDRAAIADAVYAADSNRGRASTASNLRSQAFNQAATFGMQDSDRFLDADRSNQQVALQRAMENARLQQAAAEANARMEFDRSLNNTRFEQEARDSNTDREFSRNQTNTNLEQSTRIANAGYAQDANFKNVDIANDFTVTNDQRRVAAEQRNFDNTLKNDEFRIGALNDQITAARNQQRNQVDTASTLSSLANQQASFYDSADQAQMNRINALAGVGQYIDDRNQRSYDETARAQQAVAAQQAASAQQAAAKKKKKKSIFGKFLKGAARVALGSAGVPPIF